MEVKANRAARLNHEIVQHIGDIVYREADYVFQRTVKRFDKLACAALNAVCAGLVHRFAGGNVIVNLLIAQCAKTHTGAYTAGFGFFYLR